MAIIELPNWLDDHTTETTTWYVKRLAGNDTLANGSHQAGPYLPNQLVFELFAELDTGAVLNPDAQLDIYIDSHAAHRTARVVYYNNRRATQGGTRNECRMTRLGGHASPLLDPDSTGAIAVFVFRPGQDGKPVGHIWVCNDPTEEDVIEERFGISVEPGQYLIWKPAESLSFIGLDTSGAGSDPCDLKADSIPPDWLVKFPAGQEIIDKAVALRKVTGMNPDKRIIACRACEYLIFQSVERAFFGPKIGHAFDSIEEFLAVAQSILQARKSRSGRSLELHIRQVLTEEKFMHDADFSHSAVIEGGKKPDFIFPSRAAYEDPSFPAERLRMLGAKTTVKDRWRQIINEASRIPVKHLLTLQEGVSSPQFAEMRAAGVHLVVPAELHTSYPKDVRPHLITVEGFLGDLRTLALKTQ